jgi:hypothetical protein
MYFVFFYIFSPNRAVYETIRKKIVQPDRPQVTIWCIHIARWISMATNTHSLCHCSNNYTNAPQHYVIHTFPVLFNLLAQEFGI